MTAPGITDRATQAVLLCIPSATPRSWHQPPKTINGTTIDFLWTNETIVVWRTHTSSTEPGAATHSDQNHMPQKSTVAALKAGGVNVNAVRRFLTTARSNEPIIAPDFALGLSGGLSAAL